MATRGVGTAAEARLVLIAWQGFKLARILRRCAGGVAQLGERVVRIDEVVGSIPILSTSAKKKPGMPGFFFLSFDET